MKMRCKKCGVVAEENDIYCRKCNSKVRFEKAENFCSCGAKLAENETFCFKCGKQVIPSFLTLDKERLEL